MSRQAIVGAIRRGLHRGALPEDLVAGLRARLRAHPRHLIPARSDLPRPAQVALFVRNVEKEFGTIARVRSADAVPAALAGYLAGQNLPLSFVMAPHPELQAIPWASLPLLSVREGRAEASDLVSVQHGYAAIAETGTLLLPGTPDRPTTLNLLADTAIVVLRTSRILGAMEDAWDRLRAEWRDERTGGFMPRNVMLVTGPSRSADIESTLELGAHGPRRLHVVIIDDDPAALA
jgi:L-lactate dehydrogenase complex protein LldG